MPGFIGHSCTVFIVGRLPRFRAGHVITDFLSSYKSHLCKGASDAHICIISSRRNSKLKKTVECASNTVNVFCICVCEEVWEVVRCGAEFTLPLYFAIFLFPWKRPLPNDENTD